MRKQQKTRTVARKLHNFTKKRKRLVAHHKDKYTHTLKHTESTRHIRNIFIFLYFVHNEELARASVMFLETTKLDGSPTTKKVQNLHTNCADITTCFVCVQ